MNIINNKDDFFSELEQDLTLEGKKEFKNKELLAESPAFSATIEDNYNFVAKNPNTKRENNSSELSNFS
jgi:hypothetical protein